MTQNEAIEHLKINKSKFKMLVRMCRHVKGQPGIPFDYPDNVIKMFEKYINAQKTFHQAKVEMGKGKIIRKKESKWRD